jgi:hypothetical protein
MSAGAVMNCAGAVVAEMALMRSTGSWGLSFGVVALSLIESATAFAQNTCGNQAVPPQLFSGAVVSPEDIGLGLPPNWNPSRGRLARGDIQYVSGTSLRIEIVTDKCTFIEGMTIGGRKLAPEVHNSGGYWFWVSPSTRQPADPARHSHSVSALFRNPGEGESHDVAVTIGRTGGAGTASYRFKLVLVNAVEDRNIRSKIGFSAAEMHNFIAKGLYGKYGPQNTEKAGLRVVQYDPASLSTSITAAGVSFHYKLTTVIPCGPTLNVSGTFKLNARPSLAGITFDWRNGPRASPVFRHGCELPITELRVFSALADAGLRSAIEAKVDSAKQSMEETLRQFVTNPEGGIGDFTNYLQESTTRSGELLFTANLTLPSITIQTPYVSMAEERAGTVVPRGERVLIVASGLGMNDSAAGTSPATSLWSGPNGVPRAGTVPWGNPRVVARVRPLPSSSAPVGMLLARPRLVSYGGVSNASVNREPEVSPTGDVNLGGEKVFRYAPGCVVSAPKRPPVSLGVKREAEIRFAVNDSPGDARRLRSLAAKGYRVRLIFLGAAPPQGSSNPSTSCQGL